MEFGRSRAQMIFGTPFVELRDRIVRGDIDRIKIAQAIFHAVVGGVVNGTYENGSAVDKFLRTSLPGMKPNSVYFARAVDDLESPNGLIIVSIMNSEDPLDFIHSVGVNDHAEVTFSSPGQQIDPMPILPVILNYRAVEVKWHRNGGRLQVLEQTALSIVSTLATLGSRLSTSTGNENPEYIRESDFVTLFQNFGVPSISWNGGSGQ